MGRKGGEGEMGCKCERKGEKGEGERGRTAGKMGVREGKETRTEVRNRVGKRWGEQRKSGGQKSRWEAKERGKKRKRE